MKRGPDEMIENGTDAKRPKNETNSIGPSANVEKETHKSKLYLDGEISFEQFVADLSIEKLTERVVDGEFKGCSVLLFLAMPSQRTTFMAIWEKFKDQLTIEDFRTKAEAGEDKNKTALWWLSMSVAEGVEDPFMVVWEKFKDQFTVDDLRIYSQDGDSKGTSLLCNLAAGAVGGNAAPFRVVWEKFKDQLTVEDFRAKAEDGYYKNRTILWWLSLQVAHGVNDLFMAVWETFNNQFTVDDIRIYSQDGTSKGTSILWNLARAAGGNAAPFKVVWEKFKDQLTVEDFRTKAEVGYYKNRTILWWLSLHVAQDVNDLFMAVWETLNNQFTVDDLRITSLDGKSKGTSVLWNLASAAGCGNAAPFRVVWEKFKNQLTIEDLRVTPESVDNPMAGTSVLWLLGCAAMQTKSEDLMPGWERFLPDLTVADLCKVGGTQPRMSVANVFSNANPFFFNLFAKYLCGHMAESDASKLLTNQNLKHFTYIPKPQSDIKTLLDTRMAFSAELAKVKADSTRDYKLLKHLADRSFQVGDNDAYNEFVQALEDRISGLDHELDQIKKGSLDIKTNPSQEISNNAEPAPLMFRSSSMQNDGVTQLRNVTAKRSQSALKM